MIKYEEKGWVCPATHDAWSSIHTENSEPSGLSEVRREHTRICVVFVHPIIVYLHLSILYPLILKKLRPIFDCPSDTNDNRQLTLQLSREGRHLCTWHVMISTINHLCPFCIYYSFSCSAATSYVWFWYLLKIVCHKRLGVAVSIPMSLWPVVWFP